SAKRSNSAIILDIEIVIILVTDAAPARVVAVLIEDVLFNQQIVNIAHNQSHAPFGENARVVVDRATTKDQTAGLCDRSRIGCAGVSAAQPFNVEIFEQQPGVAVANEDSR